MQYYYFICGLPSISFEDAKIGYEPNQFRADAQQYLTEADFRLLQLLHLPKEMDILIQKLYGRSGIKQESVFEESFWDSFITWAKDSLSSSGSSLPTKFKAIPEFVVKFTLDLLALDDKPDFLEAEHHLISLCYEYLINYKNKFISTWFSLERDVKNIVLAINGRHHSHSYAKYLVGDYPLTQKLSSSNAADFGLGKEYPIFDQLSRSFEQNNVLYRERAYDIIKWKWLENSLFFEYFSIDKILGYYLKLLLIARWAGMSKESGKEIFFDSLSNLENSFVIPGVFSLSHNKRDKSNQEQTVNTQ